MKITLMLWSLLLSIGQLYGQTRIAGVVRSDDSGQGMAGLSVSVKEGPNGRILAFSTTGNSGAYTLAFTSKLDSVLLVVSGLAIRRFNKTLANKSTNVDVNVVTEAIRLKEVKIVPPRVRKLGDTISYLVDGFTDRNDRTIADVLKKMPGISVNDNGQILYNNRPVNKLYIEDKDLLQGRYGIATNNLPARDVAKVEVLENHQPVKVLKDRVFSEDAAINLKLKDSAKGVLTVNGQLGAGISPLRWDNELNSMYFNSQSQILNSYKGNNAGRDVATELGVLYPGQDAGNSGSLLSVQSPVAPGISARRYLFNNSHALSLNKLWAKAKNQQTTLGIAFLNDMKEKNSYSRSEYYLSGDSRLNVEEQVEDHAMVNELEASLEVNRNKETYFLENSSRIKGIWNRDLGTIFNQSGSRQELRKPMYSVGNAFRLIKNTARGQLSLSSNTQYRRSPHHLHVFPPVQAPLFELQALSDLVQDLERSDFTTTGSAGVSIGKGAFKQNYALNFSADLQHLQSQLEGKTPESSYFILADSLENNLRWNRINIGAEPSWSLNKSSFRGTLSLPLQYLQLRSQGQRRGDDFNRIFFNPFFLVYYAISQYVNITATARLNTETGGIETGFDGYILETYRSLRKNDGKILRQREQSYNLSLNYRDPVRSVFGSLGLRYNKSRRNLLYAYDYQGIISLSRTYDIPNTAQGSGLNINLDKGLDGISGKLSLAASYDEAEAVQYTSGAATPFKSRNYQVSPGLSARPAKWLSISYRFRYTRSTYEVEGRETGTRPVKNSSHNGQLSFFPAKGLTLELANESFYTNAILNGTPRMNFADAGLKYKTKKYELVAEYSNIFNSRHYISASNNSINTFYYSYELRPAQLLMKVRFKIK